MYMSTVVFFVFLTFKCSFGVDSTESLLDRINTLERLMSDKISIVQHELYSTQRDLASLHLKFEAVYESKMMLINELCKSKGEIKECKESLSEHTEELRRTQQELQSAKPKPWISNKFKHDNNESLSDDDFHNKSRPVYLSDIKKEGKLGNGILKRIVPPTPPVVAFYARAIQSKEHLAINDAVTFENVVTNDGNGYDSNTGTFKAPIAGTYTFSVTIMSYWKEDVTVEMEKNGQNVGSTYCGNADAHAVCGHTVVLRMDIGDTFWVRITDNYHNAGNIRIFANGYSSISGFLIY